MVVTVAVIRRVGEGGIIPEREKELELILSADCHCNCDTTTACYFLSSFCFLQGSLYSISYWASLHSSTCSSIRDRDSEISVTLPATKISSLTTSTSRLHELNWNNHQKPQSCPSTHQQHTPSPNSVSTAAAGTNSVSYKPKSPPTQPAPAPRTYAWATRR